jgi:hypothetical protein
MLLKSSQYGSSCLANILVATIFRSTLYLIYSWFVVRQLGVFRRFKFILQTVTWARCHQFNVVSFADFFNCVGDARIKWDRYTFLFLTSIDDSVVMLRRSVFLTCLLIIFLMFCAGYQLVHPISMMVAFSLANFSGDSSKLHKRWAMEWKTEFLWLWGWKESAVMYRRVLVGFR